MQTKLTQEADNLERESKLAMFEGNVLAGNLFKRQAEFLREANKLVKPSDQQNWWTKVLLGDIPNWPSTL